MGAITLVCRADDNETGTASVAYTAGALTASFATDEDLLGNWILSTTWVAVQQHS